MKSYKYIIVLFLLVCISCKKGEIDHPPTVFTNYAVTLGPGVVELHGYISDMGTGCTRKGFVWGPSPSMMGVGNQNGLPAPGANDLGDYTAILNTTPGAALYFQAWASGKVGTNYGSDIIAIHP